MALQFALSSIEVLLFLNLSMLFSCFAKTFIRLGLSAVVRVDQDVPTWIAAAVDTV